LKELERANIAFKSKVDIRDKQSYLLNDRIKIISQKNVSAMSQLENRKPLQIFYLQGFIFIFLYPDPHLKILKWGKCGQKAKQRKTQ